MAELAFDVVVIGAGKARTSLPIITTIFITIANKSGLGISGIAAARFYLYIHPECRLLLLEKDTHLGGVWNSSKALVDKITNIINRLSTRKII
jgi:hypothetical protein